MAPQETIFLKAMRSIEMALYNILVIEGYTPDRDQYGQNVAAYQAKKKEIQTRKTFCVDLFGHGSPEDRDNKYIPRMVITSSGFLPGSIGNDPTPGYEQDLDGNWKLVNGPTTSSVLKFDVALVSNKTNQDSYMEYVRQKGLPNRSYVDFYDNSGKFCLQYGQYRNIPQLTHGLIQRLYTYEIIDIFETTNEVVGHVSRIKQITVKDAEDQSTITQVP